MHHFAGGCVENNILILICAFFSYIAAYQTISEDYIGSTMADTHNPIWQKKNTFSAVVCEKVGLFFNANSPAGSEMEYISAMGDICYVSICLANEK